MIWLPTDKSVTVLPTTTPAPPLSAMRLPPEGSGPPIVLPELESISTPFMALPTAIVPVRSVPISFPATVLSSAPSIWTPSSPVPEITLLSSPTSAPPFGLTPTQFPDAPLAIKTPSPVIPRGIVPVRSVPMKLPATMLPSVPAPMISIPSLPLPAMMLRSPASSTSDRWFRSGCRRRPCDHHSAADVGGAIVVNGRAAVIHGGITGDTRADEVARDGVAIRVLTVDPDASEEVARNQVLARPHR